MSLSVGSSVLLIGTENGFLIRWNVESNDFDGALFRSLSMAAVSVQCAERWRVFPMFRTAEIVVSKKKDDAIHKVNQQKRAHTTSPFTRPMTFSARFCFCLQVFIDPTGKHALVALINGKCYYLHAKTTKPSEMQKIRVGFRLLYSGDSLLFGRMPASIVQSFALGSPGFRHRVRGVEQRPGRRHQVSFLSRNCSCCSFFPRQESTCF